MGLALGNELSRLVVVDPHDSEQASRGEVFVVVRNADREQFVTLSLVGTAFEDHFWLHLPDVPVGNLLLLTHANVLVEVGRGDAEVVNTSCALGLVRNSLFILKVPAQN